MTDPLVEMHGITVDFPGVRAIDGVDLTLVEGEVHALMGENGAGKSTVIGALTGTYPLSAGAIRIGGESVSPSGVASARGRHRHGVPGGAPQSEALGRREHHAGRGGARPARHRLEGHARAGR
ncbi:ATP-binding cassette domain-containing protein [Microbacterium gubbeenense]|uniref:ATP-binding cassette domain-containing protein n=1 Tax=Microbacterium gubbeenense TaxID=159896 RepID=UPI003F98DA51